MGIAYNTSIVSDGLVFALDAANTRSYAGSGNTTYSLVGGIGCTLYNGVGLGTTNSGYFTFDGANDYIDIPTSILPYGSSPRTLCCWFLVKSIAYEWALSYGSPSGSASNALGVILGVITYAGYGGDDLYGPAPNTDTWYYACGTYNGTTASLYINGSLYISSNRTWNTVQNIASVGRQTNGVEPWNGFISQAMIYNRALTQQEIKQNYNATKKRYGL